jgi:predicted signal transduction protein with EAL and GGDEF domain
VARRLDTALTPDGHLVARMGGDEFVILVVGPAGVAAAECIDDVAQTALETIRRPVELAGQSITVSASAGVVAHPSTDAHELMKAADATLYWAKADGGDRSFAFDPERYRADLERFAFAAQMPDALQRGEFVVEYQPLVRLADRRMIGVEALVRWVTADGERRAPETFVPLAEQAYLRDLPVDGLKLAAPLVRKVAEDDGRNSVNARVVGLIVELARVLELSVVAESVETAAQAERLAALGCEDAQSWYFAPALAPEATAARVADPVFRSEV